MPPYSAGGAPLITSIDWIELDGSWLENTLLCWSGDGLTVNRKRIRRVIAEAVKQTVGIGGNTGGWSG
ncbi:MAG: hypothetical protein WDM87_15300 [Terracidiphilus sp.]